MRLLTIFLLSLTVASGCATKDFVLEQVDGRAAAIEAELNAQVSELQQTLDAAQSTIQQQAAQLGEVDNTAGNAFALATTAGEGVDTVSTRTDALEQANRQLVFEVVISDSHDQYSLSDADLPEDARAAVDRFVEQLRQLPRASFLEIEGHTDSSGDPQFNNSLGVQRAVRVRRYLHQQHQFPLHKMNIISYGEDNPIASNDDREGRAQNRRVVLRVLG